jgi:putative peptidoglycan lipid II flippase
MKKLSFLTRTSFLLGFFFAFDKLLAFARSIIIARQFRLSFELDAFNVANNLPDLLFALISGGALAMAFIPVLSEHLTLRGREDTWVLFSRVANIAFVVTTFLACHFREPNRPRADWHRSRFQYRPAKSDRAVDAP